MNDFDYDVMQKKRTARSAYAHVRFKRGGCTLPSDLKTRKEREAMNGEVKSYNVTRPMRWQEYKRLPDDLKREYWRNMQSYGGTAMWLTDYMGCSDAAIRLAAKEVGVPFARGNGDAVLWASCEAKWSTAAAVEVMQTRTDGTESAQERTNDSGECSNTLPEEKPVETLKMPTALVRAKLVLSGGRDDILQHLRLFLPDSGEVTVEW